MGEIPAVSGKHAGARWAGVHSTRRRLLLGGIAAFVVLVIAAWGAASWYYANALRTDALTPDHSADAFDLQVVALSDGRITLEPRGSPGTGWRSDGVFGLQWDGGYGQVSAITSDAGGRVVRDFTPLRGSPAPGTLARIDSFAWPGDPRTAFGLDFQQVSIEGELGALPAWRLPGHSPTWAIFVHGKGADRREGLRILPALQRAGLPALLISYRNDVGAPVGPGGYRYGATEWRDVEAAAIYALAHGARDIVLVGYSMGGGLVTNFLYRSQHADRVRAVILDAPMLDFRGVIGFEAGRRGLPGLLTWSATELAAWRFDIAWGALDYLSKAASIKPPILLFHGDSDTRIPVGASDALARERPDIVEYHRVLGAGHVRAWNTGPAAYEAFVVGFLSRVGAAAQ